MSSICVPKIKVELETSFDVKCFSDGPLNKRLKYFIEKTPSPLSFVQVIDKILRSNGFIFIDEGSIVDKIESNKCFIIRECSIIAFKANSRGSASVISSPSFRSHFAITPSSNNDDLIATSSCRSAFNYYNRELAAQAVVIEKSGENLSKHTKEAKNIYIRGPAVVENITSKSRTRDDIYYCGASKNEEFDFGLASEAHTSDAQEPSYFNGLFSSGRLNSSASAFAALTAFLESDETSESPSQFLFLYDALPAAGITSNLLEIAMSYVFGNNLDNVKSNSLIVNIHNYPHMRDGGGFGNGLTIQNETSTRFSTDALGISLLLKLIKSIKLHKMFGNEPYSNGSNIAARNGINTVECGVAVMNLGSARETICIEDLEESILGYKDVYNNMRRFNIVVS